MNAIFETLVQLAVDLGRLIFDLGTFGVGHALLIAWIAWWLWGVNWSKGWGVLAQGGWIAVVMFTVVGALVWAAIAPSKWDAGGFITIGNFWWQWIATSLLACSALFCGFVQGTMGWGPAEIDLEPPAAAAHDGHHGH